MIVIDESAPALLDLRYCYHYLMPYTRWRNMSPLPRPACSEYTFLMLQQAILHDWNKLGQYKYYMNSISFKSFAPQGILWPRLQCGAPSQKERTVEWSHGGLIHQGLPGNRRDSRSGPHAVQGLPPKVEERRTAWAQLGVSMSKWNERLKVSFYLPLWDLSQSWSYKNLQFIFHPQTNNK